MAIATAQAAQPYEANQQEICYVIGDEAYDRYSSWVDKENSDTIVVGSLRLWALRNQPKQKTETETEYKVYNPQSIELFEEEEAAEAEQQLNLVREEMLSEIRNLGNLPNNWDGYGAIRVRPKSLANAIDVISAKEIDSTMIDEVFAQPNGTVYIRWENDEKRKLGLEIGENMMSYYVDTSEETMFYERVQISEENIRKLSENISLL